MKEIKDLNKLDEKDEKGRKKYVISERTGKPVLNTPNARYRNSKYLTTKNFVPRLNTIGRRSKNFYCGSEGRLYCA